LLLLAGTPVRAQSVQTENGNVFFIDSGGRRTRLTSKGLDYDASLSLDGTRVIFVRRTVGEERSSELGEYNGHEIWVVDVTRPDQARPIVLKRSTKDPWNGLSDPQFSVDGRRVFFRNWFGNGYTLHRVELGTGEITRLGKGTCMGFEVIRRGEYKGKLLLHEERHKLGTGTIALYWVVDQDGNYLEIIGTDAGDLAMFKELYVDRSVPQ
jgi:hypothetical protein